MCNKLEAPLTLEDITVALKNMRNQRSPGTYGLPADFYKVFWNKLKPFLGELYK